MKRKEIIEEIIKKSHKKITAKEIAIEMNSKYSKYLKEKKDEFLKKGKKEKEFIQQLVAEVGSLKDNLASNIKWQDKPRPRVYWYEQDKKAVNINKPIITKKTISESNLYPMLMNYLEKKQNIYSMRIDEKKSKNTYGKDGNIWLHPDIVALKTLDESWDTLVRSCVENSTENNIKLLSYEVKIEINSSNIRKNFFQTVSNSSWANEGYLVTTEIKGEKTMKELTMLSSLHGIGVILLNKDEVEKSQIILPAKTKKEIDWESVNRIVMENKDFKEYIEKVSSYYLTKRIKKYEWNK